MLLHVCPTVGAVHILLGVWALPKGYVPGRSPVPRLGSSLQPEDPVGLRPALTQCCQGSLPWIWKEERGGQMDLDLEGEEEGS